MTALQIILIILRLLAQLKSASSAEAFVESAQASGVTLASGDLLRKIWENREEILEFILKLIEQFNKTPPATVMSADDLIAAISEALSGIES